MSASSRDVARRPFTDRRRQYDVTADGKRFLMIKEGSGDQTTAAQNLVVVQNWMEELERVVPR